MYYNLYKKSRNKSWQVLIDCNIDKLPVSVSDVARHYGIKILKNSDVKMLHDNEIGITYCTNNKYYIIYDNTVIPTRARYTIAHELGHILLGHLNNINKCSRTLTTTKPDIEYQADRFAIDLLAPACVLWGLGLTEPTEIADVCNISLQSAQIRAERLQELRIRNKFLTSNLEKTVYKNFESFINDKK